MSVQLLKRKFTVEEYNLMAEAGVFKEGDRLELIAGEIIEKSPVSPRHIDLNGEAIEVYRQPGVNGYQYLSRFVRGQTLKVGAFANVSLTVDEVFG